MYIGPGLQVSWSHPQWTGVVPSLGSPSECNMCACHACISMHIIATSTPWPHAGTKLRILH